MDANIRILVVDDEPDIRQLLRILLENRSYQVAEASLSPGQGLHPVPVKFF